MKVSYNKILEKVCRVNSANLFKEGGIVNNYTIDDEVTKKVLKTYSSNQKNSNIDELISKINQVDESFAITDIPEYEAPQFEKLENINISDEEIKEQAENSLYDYKQSSLKKIEDEISEKESTLNQNLEDLNTNVTNSKQTLEAYYDDKREDTSNDALKRGLSRSSIVINQLDAFNKDEIATYNQIEKEYQENLNSINFELNSLNLQKQQALDDFDIAYAVKLNEQISALNNELLEKQAEITKYNNEIVKQEEDYKQKYNELVNDIKNKNIDTDAKLIDLTAKYGEKVIENYRKSKVNSLVDTYFRDMEKEDIINELNNNESLRIALGSYLDEIIARYQ